MNVDNFIDLLGAYTTDLRFIDEVIVNNIKDSLCGGRCLHEVLIDSFVWVDTPQGHDFWFDVYDKLYELDNDIE